VLDPVAAYPWRTCARATKDGVYKIRTLKHLIFLIIQDRFLCHQTALI